MSMWIGMDIGGTNLRLGVFAGEGSPKLLEEMRFQADFSKLCVAHKDAPEQAWQQIVSTLANAIATVRKQYSAVVGVGIGFPGFIDPDSQKIVASPNLPGLHQLDLSADLSRLIALPVWTINDALAAAYGEYALRSQQMNSLIYLGLGTGVGGGIILDQRAVAGQHGVAMEVGHIIIKPQGRLCGCGNRGCMEQYASASGVSLTFFESSGRHESAQTIAELAQAGNQAAKHAYAIAGSGLAQALAHVLKVVDISQVVIGGGMRAAWPLMADAFTRQLDEDLIPVLRGQISLHLSELGDQAGMLGAAMLAKTYSQG